MAKRRCMAKAKWSKTRCRQRARKGMRVCRWHEIMLAKATAKMQREGAKLLSAKVYDRTLKEAEKQRQQWRESFYDFSTWLVLVAEQSDGPLGGANHGAGDAVSHTLCIFKPDLAASRANTVQALLRLLAADLVPVAMGVRFITTAEAMRLYAAHEGQPYYKRNIEFVTSGQCLIMVLDGVRAVERLREIVGATNPKKANKGTLRSMFGTELPRNAVHASGSEVEAADEIRIFFSSMEEGK